MRLGFTLPSLGSYAGSDTITTAAREAERLGFGGLWTIERLLYPVAPRAPYPATPDGSLPEPYKVSFDPLDTLAYAAGVTNSIGLGTCVLDMPFYNPVVLARRLATIDVLSGGRLRVGMGLGWSPDEMEAAGADITKRGRQADEFLQVLKAAWTQEEVEFKGKYFSVPRSIINHKPAQKPHPPIYLAAYVPAAMARVAAHAQGWIPAGVPVAAMPEMFGAIKEMAKGAGRDPSSLELVVLANVELTDSALGDDRWSYMGTWEQVDEDIAACKEMGATEVIVNVLFSHNVSSASDYMRAMERARKSVS